MLLEEGRVCIKKNGRDAGDKAIVIKVLDQSHVLVMTESRPKGRRCNISHLEFLNEKIDANDQTQIKHTLGIVERQATPEKANRKQA